MGGGRADGGQGRRAGGPRRQEPALQSGSPGGAGGAEEAGGGGAAPRPRPTARPPARSHRAQADRSSRSQRVPAASRPSLVRAGSEAVGGPGSGAAGGEEAAVGAAASSRAAAQARGGLRLRGAFGATSDRRRGAGSAPGSLRVVSQDRPEVRGCPWGRLGGRPRGQGAGRGPTGRCARAPSLG